jgi:anaerobic magnesium-protoporphyrin IX monomethyl ester cyclase
MDKGIKIEEIKKAFYLLKQKGIKAALFLQFGYLDETMNDIKQTIDMVTELLPDDIGVSVSYPLPGTKFYDKVSEQLKNKANWKDSDDLHLMFKNTYSSEFYKHLHRYLHHIYRAEMAKSLIQTPSLKYLKRIASWTAHKIRAYKEKNIIKKLEPDAAKFL